MSSSSSPPSFGLKRFTRPSFETPNEDLSKVQEVKCQQTPLFRLCAGSFTLVHPLHAMADTNTLLPYSILTIGLGWKYILVRRPYVQLGQVISDPSFDPSFLCLNKYSESHACKSPVLNM